MAIIPARKDIFLFFGKVQWQLFSTLPAPLKKVFWIPLRFGDRPSKTVRCERSSSRRATDAFAAPVHPEAMLSPPPASATSRRALPLLSALLGAVLLVLLPISVTLLASSNPSRVQLPTEKSDVVEINSGWYTIEQFDDPEYCIRGDASYVYHVSFEACNAKPYLEFVSRVNVEGFDRPYSWSATCDADGLHQSVYEYEGDCDDPLTVLDPGCTWPPPEQTCAVPLTATETVRAPPRPCPRALYSPTSA